MTETGMPEDIQVSELLATNKLGIQMCSIKRTKKTRVPYRLKSTVDAERAELVASSLVPGMVYCAKCDFTLTRRVIHGPSGNVGTGSNETEACPNGCGPLWSYTWRKLCDDFEKRLDQELAERAADSKTIAALAGTITGILSRIEGQKITRVEWLIKELQQALSENRERIAEANHIQEVAKMVETQEGEG